MLNVIDWVIIGVYFIITFWIGLLFTKKAGKNTNEFFLGGRNLSWWLSGLSLVATTFAADTPLAVTEIVRKNGIAGNWVWWSMLTGGMLTAFFFARYWRRAEVLTDVELISLRYSGKEARFLRGFKALYFGALMNTLIMGWVNLAMATVLSLFFGLSHTEAITLVAACMLLIAFYAGSSGLQGVVFTDAFQFVLAMGGCVILAYFVVQAAGGMDSITTFLATQGGLSFFPTLSTHTPTLQYSIAPATFFTFLLVQWWASWYPGAEPGGGGYVAQRLMATRSEKDALWATLLFQSLHYALRPWPWILVGLASFILYPNLSEADYKTAYILAMQDYLPLGLKGLLIATFLAAYMSTIATHINWGTSYIVNDFYQPFIQTDKDAKHYVKVSRLLTVFIVLISAAVTYQLNSIEKAWMLLLECGAGAGLPLILRWYWWRVSAYSELAAFILPLFGYLIGQWLSTQFTTFQYPYTYLFTVSFTTLGWLLVTFLTPPTDTDTLKHFYEKVQPRGNWSIFFASTQENQTPFYIIGIAWLCATAFVYAALFGVGSILFSQYNDTILYVLLAASTFLILYYLNKRYKILE